MSVNKQILFSLLFLAFFMVNFAFGQSPTQAPDPASYGMTSGRLLATSAAVIGLIGVVIGAISIARSAGWARIGALIAGLIAAAVGGFRVITASGIGTGGGRAGAIVAFALGLIAIALSGYAFTRSRRAATEQGR